MKGFFRKISIIWVVLIAYFIPTSTSAAVKKDVSSRVNKVRKTLHEKIKKGDAIELTGKQFHSNNLDEWVNWGNWGNWGNF